MQPPLPSPEEYQAQMEAEAQSASQAASLAQLTPFFREALASLKPILDQPVTREPFWLGTSAPGGTVIPPGVNNAVLPIFDFTYSLEEPFEMTMMRFTLDPAHTYSDVMVSIQDNTFSHTWSRNAVLLDTMIDPFYNAVKFVYPWVIRPMGGGLNIFVTNLDPANPLTVYATAVGSRLIPR